RGALSPDFLTDLFRDPLDPGYAAAARRRAGRPEPPPWRRAGGGGARAVVLILIGFLLTVAYQYAMRARPATSQARASLVSDVKDRRAQTDELQRRADALRGAVNRQRDAALAGEGGEGGRLRELDAVAGLSEVRG